MKTKLIQIFKPAHKENPVSAQAKLRLEAEKVQPGQQSAMPQAAQAEREKAQRHRENVEFAEQLVSAGKLAPRHKEVLVAVLEQASIVDDALQSSEVSARKTTMEILAAFQRGLGTAPSRMPVPFSSTGNDMPAIPNTCKALELAVIERLTDRFPGLSVELYPEEPEGYSLNHPVGALQVRYAGSTYGPIMDTKALVQERRLALQVTLVMRSLHGENGATETLDQVRLALAGYAPPAFGKLVPVSDEFLGERGGEWRHAIDFITTTTMIEQEESDLSSRSTRLTFLGENSNDPQVQVPRPDRFKRNA